MSARAAHALVATALLASVAPAPRAQRPAPDAAAPIAVIPLEPRRALWTIHARIGGKERHLLFDTGAGITLVTAAVAHDAGCTPWGVQTGYNMFGTAFTGPHCDDVAVEVAGQRRIAPRAGLVDMAKLNPKDADLDGIAGLDLFDGALVTLDFPGSRLVIESPASLAARTRGMHEVRMRMKREMSGISLTPVVAVPTRMGTLWMELDSGNGGTVLVTKPLASLLGLDSTATGKQHAEFPLTNDVRVVTDDAMTPPMIMDGNLGMPAMRHWVVTLDLRDGRAWIAAP